MPTNELSLVIPVHNEQGNLLELYQRLQDVLKNNLQVTYEILFVDDGSTDDSWNIIQDLHNRDNNVKGMRFSRNFGHDLALKAGIDNSAGNIVICMDSDLQHPAELLPKIFSTFQTEDIDIVFMKRVSNQDATFFRKISNKIYYLLFRKLTGLEIEQGLSDFYGISRKIVNVIRQTNEKDYFLRGILLSIGFRKCYIEYQAHRRFSGKSNYNLRNLVQLSVTSIVNFTPLPLKIVEFFAFLVAFLSFTQGLVTLVRALLQGTPPGYATIITLLAFLNGSIMLILIFYIEYFIVAFHEIKNRPAYLIDDLLGEYDRDRMTRA